jgi:hypothetical protein
MKKLLLETGFLKQNSPIEISIGEFKIATAMLNCNYNLRLISVSS